MRNSGIIRANEPALDYLLRGLKSADIAARVRLHLLNALHEGLPTEETIASSIAHEPAKTPYRDGTTQVAFEPVDFIARLAALVPKPRVNLTRYHGVLAPNHRWRGEVTPAKRGKGVNRIANTEVRSPAERHVAMSWAQRLKRVFNIDIEACGRCGGSLKVIACIEDQDIIDRILAHLRDKELATPSLPLLTPPSRAPPETLPLFAGKDSSSTALNQQGSH